MSMPPSSNNKKHAAALEGISAISVRGYKSLYDECRLEIRPLTILAGANSSGKSSAMQPLLLLKQTLEAGYDPGPLLLNGPNVRFTSVERLFSRMAEKKISDEFTIKLEIEKNRSITSSFKKHLKKNFDLAETVYRDGSGITRLRTEKKLEKITPETLKLLLGASYEALAMEDRENFDWRIIRQKCFLGVELFYKGEKIGLRLPIFSDPFELHIRKLIHLPGLRGNPERNYKTTAIGAEFPGTFEHYVASVVHHWQVSEDNRLRKLSDALATLGLTWKVEAKQVDDTQVELRVGRLPKLAKSGAMDMVSIADVGFGISQTLPVLVALLTAEPGQIVYLEQPEIHLHPRAQVALAQVLTDAANRGVRVVAETHSSLLLLGVQSLVAEGKLAPDKIKLHWFKRRGDGVTEVTSADLDEAGAFGDWPEDFADVALETESRYIEAAALSHRKKQHARKGFATSDH